MWRSIVSVVPDPDFLHRLADTADAETLPRYRQPLDIETKERPGRTFDPVTEADRSAEVALRAAISATHPDHAILGEEYGETGSDPVDGCSIQSTEPALSSVAYPSGAP
jgi:fructose-1,6-bisphosphatase/inositol monophosphatase family enzyme